MPSAPPTGTGLLILDHEGHRVVVPTPESYDEAIELCQRYFTSFAPNRHILLHTRELDICPGEPIEVGEEAWGAVKDRVNIVEVSVHELDEKRAVECDAAQSTLEDEPKAVQQVQTELVPLPSSRKRSRPTFDEAPKSPKKARQESPSQSPAASQQTAVTPESTAPADDASSELSELSEDSCDASSDSEDGNSSSSRTPPSASRQASVAPEQTITTDDVSSELSEVSSDTSSDSGSHGSSPSSARSKTSSRASSEASEEALGTTAGWTPHPGVKPPPAVYLHEIDWAERWQVPSTCKSKPWYERASELLTDQKARLDKCFHGCNTEDGLALYSNWNMQDGDEEVKALLAELYHAKLAVQFTILADFRAYRTNVYNRRSVKTVAYVGSDEDMVTMPRAQVWTKGNKLLIFRTQDLGCRYYFFRIAHTDAASMGSAEIRALVRAAVPAALAHDNVSIAVHKTRCFKKPKSGFDIMVKCKDYLKARKFSLPVDFNFPRGQERTITLGGRSYQMHKAVVCRLCQGGLHQWKECPLQHVLGAPHNGQLWQPANHDT
ncbi:hypothetical protein BD626DRAFT_513009 [Schizophyllum amplum]|uniref:Uncharacterized protein n=1 Tax=Schizophyllum amplum TaxID=97359 RepID=A0A550BZP1_9AGAR|nr:hypothetical protein BD626DRAFT_513009 [Auriculariopsis ampla]